MNPDQLNLYLEDILENDRTYTKSEILNYFKLFNISDRQLKTTIRNDAPYINCKVHDIRDKDAIVNSKLELEEKGYTVLSNILNESELNNTDKLFWEMMYELNPNIDPENRNTWNNKTFPGEFSTGISGYYGMCQSDYAWDIRCNKVIQDIYANYHSVEIDDLCCSMDCVNIMFDYKNKKKSWLHRDQAWWLEHGDTLSLQGFYSRYSVGTEDSGFVCVPGSHKLKYTQDKGKRHYVVLDENDDLHKSAVKILIPENSLIIFNSKLLHCNQSGTKNRGNTIEGKPQLNRVGVYVSYWPKSLRTSTVLRNKKELYKKGQGTSHWGILSCKKSLVARWPRSNSSDELNVIKPMLLENSEIPLDRLKLM